MKTCKDCGRTYDLVCAPCFNKVKESVLLDEMEKVGLTIPRLMRDLAGKVNEGSFQALSKAINLLGLMPTGKVEVTGEGGGPIEIADAKTRVTDIFARIAARIAEGADDPGDEPGGTKGGAGGVG